MRFSRRRSAATGFSPPPNPFLWGPPPAYPPAAASLPPPHCLLGGDPGLIMAESRGGWRRAAALLAVSFLLSVATPTLLVAIPFALLALAVPPRRASTVGLAVGALVVIAGVGSQTSEWYMERGWALLLGGWFLA